MKGQEVILCNKCGGNKVDPAHAGTTSFLTGSCLLWIPVIGWILAPFFFLYGVLSGATKNVMYKCKDCKHHFNVDKETHKKYKQELYGNKKTPSD